MPKKILRKQQQRDLLAKLTKFVKNKIAFYINTKKWTATEIACEIGSHSSRISEIKKDTRMVSRAIFRNLYKSDFFDMDDIIHEVHDLNENEIKWIKELIK